MSKIVSSVATCSFLEHSTQSADFVQSVGEGYFHDHVQTVTPVP